MDIQKINIDLLHQGKLDLIEFYLKSPANLQKANNGNGTMIAFKAKTNEIVNEFHQIALNNGWANEGLPGPRDNQHYYAYIYGILIEIKYVLLLNLKFKKCIDEFFFL